MKYLGLLLIFLAVSVFAAPGPHGILYTSTTNMTTLYCGTVTKVYTFSWTFPAAMAFDWLTTDTVNPGVAGTKYFCAATLTVSGIESGYSNEVSAIFPTVPTVPQGLSAVAF